MNLKDLFVPKYLHSDPKVRMKFVNSTDDWRLLEQMSDKDADAAVRKAAAERAKAIHPGQYKAS
jgi:hypothetical protein